MAPRKTKKRYSTRDKWRLHDTYQTGPSCNRIVTRSQSVIFRLKNTPSDLNLFADSSRHQPPNKPHLMQALKGEYGSIPRTIITRSFGKHMKIDENLCKIMDSYKNYESKYEENEKFKWRNQMEDKSMQPKEKIIDTNKKGENTRQENKNSEKQDECEKGKEKVDEEEIHRKTQADEEKNKKIQAEEIENEKKRNEEENKDKEDDEDYDLKRSTGLFGGRLSNTGFGSLFDFSSDDTTEES